VTPPCSQVEAFKPLVCNLSSTQTVLLLATGAWHVDRWSTARLLLGRDSCPRRCRGVTGRAIAGLSHLPPGCTPAAPAVSPLCHYRCVPAALPSLCPCPAVLPPCCAEVVPGMLILLPATTGGVAKALEMYSGMAQVNLPSFLPGVLALCTTALIAGAGKVRQKHWRA